MTRASLQLSASTENSWRMFSTSPSGMTATSLSSPLSPSAPTQPLATAGVVVSVLAVMLCTFVELLTPFVVVGVVVLVVGVGDDPLEPLEVELDSEEVLQVEVG